MRASALHLCARLAEAVHSPRVHPLQLRVPVLQIVQVDLQLAVLGQRDRGRIGTVWNVAAQLRECFDAGRHLLLQLRVITNLLLQLAVRGQQAVVLRVEPVELLHELSRMAAGDRLGGGGLRGGL